MSFARGIVSPAWGAYHKYRSEHKRNKEGSKKDEKAYKKYLKKMGKDKFVQKSSLTPEQKTLLKTVTKKATSDIKSLPGTANIPKPTDTELYKAGKRSLLDMLATEGPEAERAREPLMRQFRQQIVPEIAERFSGITGGQRGSGFNNAMAEAASMLSSNLNAQRMGAIAPALSYAQMPMQEQSNLRQIALGGSGQSLSTDPYFQAYYPGANIAPMQRQQNPGFMHNILGNLLPSIGGAAGAAIGGPIGGVIGSGIGSIFGNGGGSPRGQGFGLI